MTSVTFKTLSISKNELTIFPSLTLPNVWYLNVENYWLRTLPISIMKATSNKLQLLSLQGDNIETLSKGTLEGWQSSKIIVLNNNPLISWNANVSGTDLQEVSVF